MKGYRTLLVNVLLASGAAGLHYVAGVDFTQYGVDATTAAIIVAGVNFALRFVTTTPVGGK